MRLMKAPSRVELLLRFSSLKPESVSCQRKEERLFTVWERSFLPKNVAERPLSC